MTTLRSKSILAAFVLGLTVAGTVAKADDFGSQTSQASANAYLDQQARNSQTADPTAPDSVRSHGSPVSH